MACKPQFADLCSRNQPDNLHFKFYWKYLTFIFSLPPILLFLVNLFRAFMQMPGRTSMHYFFQRSRQHTLHVIFTLIFCFALLYFVLFLTLQYILYNFLYPNKQRTNFLFSVYSCIVFMDIQQFIKPAPFCGPLDCFQSLAIMKNASVSMHSSFCVWVYLSVEMGLTYRREKAFTHLVRNTVF